MKTKLIKLSVLLGIIISMFIIPQAVCAETEGDYTYEVENGEAIITDVSGNIEISDAEKGNICPLIKPKSKTF